MKKIKYIILIAVISVFFTVISAYADSIEDKPQFDDSSVIVITKPSYSGIRLYSTESDSKASLDDVMNELGITEAKIVFSGKENKSGIQLFSVQTSDYEIMELTLPDAGAEKVLSAVDVLNNSGAVKYAQPNYYYYLESVPDDPKYSVKSYRYHLDKINAQDVWDMNIDCSGVAVAVIDSGILMTHEDFINSDNVSNIWTNPNEKAGNGVDDDKNGYVDDIHGWDFAEKDNNPDDTYDSAYASSSTLVQGHGTHVSGIISAATNNGKGVASLSKNAKIVPLKIFKDATVDGDRIKVTNTSWIISAISYIKNNKIPIANCSWGGSGNDNAIYSAFESTPDTLFICSAGNDGSSNTKQPIYPACYDLKNIMSVAASTAGDKLCSFSNYGSNVDIAAPGESIHSTKNTELLSDSYGSMSGTSQAAPLVASAAAVIKAKYPDLSPAEIKQAILDGADVVESLSYTGSNKVERRISGNRRLNAYEAVKYAGSPYQITWKYDDGAIIDTTYAAYGAVPSHSAPEKASTEEFSYTFKEWYPEVTAVTDDTEYTAVFEEKRIAYKITWKNDDGSVIDTEYVACGDMPAHDNAAKNSDEIYDYTFVGWYPEVTTVNSEMEYTAVYEKSEKEIPKTTIDVTDRFNNRFTIQKLIAVDGNAVLSIIPDNGDGTSSGGSSGGAGASPVYGPAEYYETPNIKAYLVVYDDGALVSIEEYSFDTFSTVIEPNSMDCRLFIWTDKQEPVINPINDMTDFWSIPSQ